MVNHILQIQRQKRRQNHVWLQRDSHCVLHHNGPQSHDRKQRPRRDGNRFIRAVFDEKSAPVGSKSALQVLH